MEWRARLLGFLVLCSLVIIVNAVAIIAGTGTGAPPVEHGQPPGLVYNNTSTYGWLQP